MNNTIVGDSTHQTRPQVAVPLLVHRFLSIDRSRPRIDAVLTTCAASPAIARRLTLSLCSCGSPCAPPILPPYVGDPTHSPSHSLSAVVCGLPPRLPQSTRAHDLRKSSPRSSTNVQQKRNGVGKAIGQFGIGTFFWAMRSCEYLKIPQAEKGLIF